MSGKIEYQNLQIKLGGKISGDINYLIKYNLLKKIKTSNDNVSMQEAMKKEEKIVFFN